MNFDSKPQNQVIRFDGTDFSVWKTQVYAFLVAKEIDSVLESKPRKLVDSAKEEDKQARIALI